MINRYLHVINLCCMCLANHRAQLPRDPPDRHQQTRSQSHRPEDEGLFLHRNDCYCCICLVLKDLYNTFTCRRLGWNLTVLFVSFPFEAALINVWVDIVACQSKTYPCVYLCRTSWPPTLSLRSPTGAVGTPTSTSPSATWSEEANCCVRHRWWVAETHTHVNQTEKAEQLKVIL